jgi:biotin operon repressor
MRRGNTGRESNQHLTPKEVNFLTLIHTIGLIGLLILRRLRHLSGNGYCTTSEEDLAKHCGRSVATVKRYLNRLRDAGFLQIENRGQDCYGRWQANKYVILLAGREFLNHFEAPPQLTDAPQISPPEKKKTSSQPMSYGFEEGARTINGHVYFYVKRVVKDECKSRAELRQGSTTHTHDDVTETVEKAGLSVWDSR